MAHEQEGEDGWAMEIQSKARFKELGEHLTVILLTTRYAQKQPTSKMILYPLSFWT